MWYLEKAYALMGLLSDYQVEEFYFKAQQAHLKLKCLKILRFDILYL